MLWKCWLLSYALKKPAEAGFSAGDGIFMQKTRFGSFVELLKKRPKGQLGFVFIFLRHECLEFLNGFFKIRFDIEVVHSSLLVLALGFDSVSTMRQRNYSFLKQHLLQTEFNKAFNIAKSKNHVN